jgi:type II secretory pathway pseudopilin PulG
VRDERGFSRELVIAIVIISLLIVIAFNRVLELRFEAERMTVQSVVTGLLSALYIDFAAAAARGQMDRIDAAPGSNPMLRLIQKPATYAGEFYGPDPATFEPGTWYFDTREHALVYIIRFPKQFVTPLSGPPRARFAVEADYEDVDHNGRFDPGRDPVRGLKLVPLESFSWKEKQ